VTVPVASRVVFAALVGVSIRTIDRLLREGAIRSVRIRGRVLIPLADALRDLGISADGATPRPNRDRRRAERERLAARALLAGTGFPLPREELRGAKW
jgi:excisionase family DNA binding protein